MVEQHNLITGFPTETSLSVSPHTRRLADQLGVSFHDTGRLEHALTHRSLLNEHPERFPGQTSNERLEFLGDAVLNMLTATWLYEHYPEASEGHLTSLRSALVKTPTLARFARELHLGEYVRISRGEEANGARERLSLLADTFEAVLGAIYLDQGLAEARSFVLPFLEREAQRIASGQSDTDYRSRLQELVQSQHSVTPVYQTVQVSGPDHSRQFTIEVLVQGTCIGSGSGSSKQSAAQEAARAALERWGDQDIQHTQERSESGMEP